ncbi:MAG: hypothetical protein FJY55_08805 [Betaproteobacteria bacterium]|nr:hypothetical protein [Betaproteobacteria bacterium]
MPCLPPPGRRSLLLVLAVLLLAGCYADLDWRKLASEAGRFQVLMPARSQSASRSIGSGATMTLWTTSARDALFGVNYTDYPDAGVGHLPQARDALLGIVSGSLVDERPLDAPLRGAPSPARDSRRIPIDGRAPGAASGAANPVGVWAHVHAIDRRLYQLTIVAPPDASSEGGREMFFSAFELR